jgi:hypothetical protein
MSKPVYVLDTNALISPYRRYYRFSFCPGFWDFVRQQFEKQETVSIAKVHEEISRNADDLSAWLKAKLDKKLFADTTKDDEVVTKYEEVVAWVISNDQYNEIAKRTFLKVDAADPWLCAYAAVYGSTVVTEEVSKPQSKKRISLADVLDTFNVPYIDVFKYLEVQQARFVLIQ